MNVTQTIDISTPADRVWSILDEGFDTISAWAARMLESHGDESLGELGGRQVVTVEYGPSTETLYVRDAGARLLGYHVAGPNLPEPISDVRTEWAVEDNGVDGHSRVEIRFMATVAPPEAEPMLEATLRQGMTPLLEELKHFAETGQPHPNNEQGAVVA